MLRKIFAKFKELVTWLFSADVREAINRGATYEEVAEVVAKEMER